MIRRSFPALAALLLATACTSAEAPKQAVNDAAARLNAALDASVRTAADVHKAMRAAPAKGDSILAAAHLTAEQFESLMHRIASDSAMSADYKRLTQ